VGHPGGFADRIRIDGRFAFPVPAELPSAEAAPLLCAGATVFAPLRRWRVKQGAQVGVLGIGGLGSLALQFLVAMGCETTALTSSADKRTAALALGARSAASSNDVRELRSLARRFDFLLCTAPVRLDWISLLNTLRPNGVLCLVGAPPGLIQIPAGQLVLHQKVVCGSDIASRAEIRETLAFAAEHGIRAQVETAPLPEVNRALQRVRDNQVRYRMVLTA
jgi:uncharacterized zinc-type alcohol dehydrogenase-like protein